jgi:hypothetical protein
MLTNTQHCHWFKHRSWRAKEPPVNILVKLNIFEPKAKTTIHGYKTNSMEQSPSWEANRSSATQEIPRVLWNPEGSIPHSQQPATCPYPEGYKTFFSKNLEATSHSRRQEGDTKQVAHWRPTNIRRRRTKFSRLGDLAPSIWASSQ